MQKITLYRYTRVDGGVTISPVKPECDCTKLNRLVADSEMLLTDGVVETTCVDTENPDIWYEKPDVSHEDNPFLQGGETL